MFYFTLRLIEEKMKYKDVILLANVVLETQKIREESWDNNKKKYNLTIDKAAIKAVRKLKVDNDDKSLFIHFSVITNTHYWNDIQSWAEKYC